MSKKEESKNSCACYDPVAIRRQEIRDDIKSINTRSAWLLGLSVVILLGLGGFLFGNAGTTKEEISLFDHSIRFIAKVLFYIYLSAVAIYMRPLMKINLKSPDNKKTEEELQKTLYELISRFNTLVFMFISPLLVCFILASLYIFVPSEKLAFFIPFWSWLINLI